MNEQILNWKQAAIAWGEGKDIQCFLEYSTGWTDKEDSNHTETTFFKNGKYRLKEQADEKSTVAETASSSPKQKRFKRDPITWNPMDNGKIMTQDESVCLLNSLHKENEDLKKDIELYKVDNQSIIKQLAYTKTACGEAGQLLINAKKELSQVKEERDKLKKDVKILEGDFESLIKQKCGYIRACKRYEDDIMRLEKGLPRLTRDEYDKMCPISSKWDEAEAEFIARKLSNDNQPTPTEKTDDTQKLHEEFHAQWCANNVFERLEKVERILDDHGMYL